MKLYSRLTGMSESVERREAISVGMKLPAASCGVSQNLKHSELPKIFPRLPLPLHIPFNGLPVCSLPYCGHIVSVGPKLPTPQYPFHRGFSAKDLSRREALGGGTKGSGVFL
jgi:hypothetical protein